VAGELLSRVRAEIDARREALRPAVAEYERLLSAAAALKVGAVDARTHTRSSPRAAAPAPRRAPARRGSAGAATVRAPAPAAGRRRAGTAAGRARVPRGAAQEAIVAALEHGSHTVSELGVVTAMSGASIRENLRRLMDLGTVTRAKRDGKAAYALAGAAKR